jgi:hypothetical protein
VAALFEFVDYLVSGGPAGVSDHLKVYPDGRAVYDAGAGKPETTFSVSPATVAELRAALEAADLAALPPVSGTPSPDAPAYRVLYGGQAVRFYDGAVPDSLRPALAILDRELSRGKRPRP